MPLTALLAALALPLIMAARPSSAVIFSEDERIYRPY
jgi:hypothetical protein